MRAVLNFAKGKWYPRGAKRLRDTIARHDETPFLFMDDESQLGCPSHEEAPYAFKPAMFNRALECGVTLALWADAACFAIKPLTPMFEHIQKHGYMFFSNGIVGEWSSDVAIDKFGLTRDGAMNVTELTGSCIGLDLTNEMALEFLRSWTEKSLDGVTFPGSWHNKNGEVSSDSRVKGHRHDQTAASLIAWSMGMDLLVPHETYYQYFESPTGKPWSENEPNDMSLIRPGVVLCNQGM